METGFWHNDTKQLGESTKLYKCKPKHVCVAVRNGSTSTVICQNGTAGVKCSACASNFTAVGSSGVCVQCTIDTDTSVVLALLIFTISMAVLTYLHDTAKTADRNNGLALSIFIDYCQTISTLTLYSLSWTPSSGTILDIASGANFGAGIASAVCFHLNYFQTFTLNILSPFIVLGVLALICFAKSWTKHGADEKLRDSLGRGVLMVAFLSYSNVVRSTLSFFRWSTVDGQRLLAEDMDFSIDGPEHAGHYPVAILGLVITVLVPLSFAALMATIGVWYPEKLKLGNMAYRIGGFSFMPFHHPSEYHEEPFTWQELLSSMWEAIRLVRKGGLVALAILSDADAQLCLALIWINLHVVLLSWISPFLELRNTALELFALVCVFLTLALGRMDESLLSDEDHGRITFASGLIVFFNVVLLVTVVAITAKDMAATKEARSMSTIRENSSPSLNRSPTAMSNNGLARNPSLSRSPTTVSNGELARTISELTQGSSEGIELSVWHNLPDAPPPSHNAAPADYQVRRASELDELRDIIPGPSAGAISIIDLQFAD
jgi:hypothetical protein